MDGDDLSFFLFGRYVTLVLALGSPYPQLVSPGGALGLSQSVSGDWRGNP